ncbi:APC family permease [Haloarcula marina]|uniref:APC family permease n=1 Tax=Haloarcula marina TaxID=2961574 RepID=UPI0020B7463C|nr:APC family permease [Halomicroarcula marina]
MSGDKLGLPGAAAIGLGGMIGGGVFSVLGVVVGVAGPAAWMAFTAASLVSMCAAYSYIALNRISDQNGGSVTQIEQFLGNGTLAGMVGWTLLFGYVGAIAMYAFAFGEFAVRLVPDLGLGVPIRPVASIAAVGLFVLLNVVGARATGTSEEVLVALKILILGGVSVAGLYFGWQSPEYTLTLGFSRAASIGLVTATAISFVSFQGWQLLVYDYESIKDASKTIPRAIYVSIVGAIIIDSLVAILVVNLAERQTIQAHPEIAVAQAVEPFLGEIGFTFVAVAALFSTGSAINGTLFSAAHFTKRLLSDGLVPDQLGDSDSDGAPQRTVVVLGFGAAAFAAVGSLGGITSFGSLAFLVVFGTMSWLAFTQRDHDEVSAVWPACGVLGTAAFGPILLWHLATKQPAVFETVVLLTAVVVGLELLYFERDSIEDGVAQIETKL